MFHDGERAVQRRAGVERAAARVGRNIMSGIPGEYAEFLTSRTFVVLAGCDARGRTRASLRAGRAGFARAVDDRRLLLASRLAATDPLAAALEPPGGSIGILAIEPEARSHVRLNGAGERTPDGNLVEVTEVFGNCRKFIQRRLPGHGLDPPRRPQRPTGTGLDAYQAALIRRADTFFIASSHPQRGAESPTGVAVPVSWRSLAGQARRGSPTTRVTACSRRSAISRLIRGSACCSSTGRPDRPCS